MGRERRRPASALRSTALLTTTWTRHTKQQRCRHAGWRSHPVSPVSAMAALLSSAAARSPSSETFRSTLPSVAAHSSAASDWGGEPVDEGAVLRVRVQQGVLRQSRRVLARAPRHVPQLLDAVQRHHVVRHQRAGVGSEARQDSAEHPHPRVAAAHLAEDVPCGGEVRAVQGTLPAVPRSHGGWSFRASVEFRVQVETMRGDAFGSAAHRSHPRGRSLEHPRRDPSGRSPRRTVRARCSTGRLRSRDRPAPFLVPRRR